MMSILMKNSDEICTLDEAKKQINNLAIVLLETQRELIDTQRELLEANKAVDVKLDMADLFGAKPMED